ncbi:MAG: class IV adenylate cyclase [Acidobacteria bacterium]|nr:class IV adenylate cyclase [Acidobacteriota bacterium]MYJ05559.1 class IV adenylate cyclase [Acidobacteriota bacterium]
MSTPDTHVEREVKLAFASADAARAAVAGLGAVPRRARRLQDDRLLDTADGRLRTARSTLRVRIESAAAAAEDGGGETGGRAAATAAVTFKGPPQPDVMKVREERETAVADGEEMLAVLEAAGFEVIWRYQKYRQEFDCGSAVVAIDETPAGVYVELEGDEASVTALALALGRDTEDYINASYRGLWEDYCGARGRPVDDMVFD